MITNVLKSGRGRQMRRAERCSLRKIRPAVVGCEDRGTGHEPRNVVSSRSWKRQGNKFSPSAPRDTSPTDALVFAQGGPCQNSALQTVS